MDNETIPQLSVYDLTSDHLPFKDGVIVQRKHGCAPHLGVVGVSFPAKKQIVVWTVNLQDAYRERGGGFYSGSYFDSSELKAAHAEFLSR